MAKNLIPPLEELRERYADIMADESVTSISYWNMPNKDSQCDENDYLKKCLDNGDLLNDKLEEALWSVHRKS